MSWVDSRYTSVHSSRDTECIVHVAGIQGGAATIRNTRIPVWVLVDLYQQGESMESLVEGYPGADQHGIDAALAYYAEYPKEIDAELDLQDLAQRAEFDDPEYRKLREMAVP